MKDPCPVAGSAISAVEKWVSKSVQVLLTGIEAVMVLTLRSSEPCLGLKY